jgi:hypothetical protein
MAEIFHLCAQHHKNPLLNITALFSQDRDDRGVKSSERFAMTSPSTARQILGSVLSLSLVVAAGASILPQRANAHGPDEDTYACRQGYTWREARRGDIVCVTPEVRAQVVYDNQQAPYRYEPYGGPYGPDTCRQGYVWREAFAQDHVCVTPQTRAQASYDNQQAPYRAALPSRANRGCDAALSLGGDIGLSINLCDRSSL